MTRLAAGAIALLWGVVLAAGSVPNLVLANPAGASIALGLALATAASAAALLGVMRGHRGAVDLAGVLTLAWVAAIGPSVAAPGDQARLLAILAVPCIAWAWIGLALHCNWFRPAMIRGGARIVGTVAAASMLTWATLHFPRFLGARISDRWAASIDASSAPMLAAMAMALVAVAVAAALGRQARYRNNRQRLMRTKNG